MPLGNKDRCYNICCDGSELPTSSADLISVSTGDNNGEYYLCKKCIDWCKGKYTLKYKWRKGPKKYSRDDDILECIKSPKKAISF